MKTHVLDTSVAIAWYLPESFAAQAKRWRDKFASRRARLIVPSLHYWEFANVLRTYVRRGDLAESLAHEIYETHLGADLNIVEPDRTRVLATALEYGATAYDAVYITLAMDHDAPLLTAERTTTPWVVRLGKLVEAVS